MFIHASYVLFMVNFVRNLLSVFNVSSSSSGSPDTNLSTLEGYGLSPSKWIASQNIQPLSFLFISSNDSFCLCLCPFRVSCLRLNPYGMHFLNCPLPVCFVWHAFLKVPFCMGCIFYFRMACVSISIYYSRPFTVCISK